MLSLEPGLAERFDSALDCVRAGVYSSHRPLKAIAAEMDTSVSTLSRKLAAHPARIALIQWRYDQPLNPQPAFDLIVFSYCLSMIDPGWERALDA